MTFLDTTLVTAIVHEDLVSDSITTRFSNNKNTPCLYRHLSFTGLKAEACTDYSCLNSALLRFA